MLLQGDKARIQRYTKEAIALAMQGRWQEAVTINKAILELSPEDVDAYNRLGRALMEMGEYDKAKEAYSRALELVPYNNIARKNLARLSHLAKFPPAPKDEHEVSLDIFIEEASKARVVDLIYLSPEEVLAKMAPGDRVSLEVEGGRLLVKNGHEEYLGEVEPKYGWRLVELIRGGNKYVAAISSLGENKVKVIIREVYQHPSQIGRLSFPQKGKEGFRSYTKESLSGHRLLSRHRLEEEEPVEESEELAEIEGGGFTVTDLYEVSIIDEEQKKSVLSEENGDRDS